MPKQELPWNSRCCRPDFHLTLILECWMVELKLCIRRWCWGVGCHWNSQKEVYWSLHPQPRSLLREREGKTLDDKCISTWTPGAVGPWLVWQGGDDWFASTESSHQWWNHSEPGDQDKKWQNDKLKKKYSGHHQLPHCDCGHCHLSERGRLN